MQTLLYLKAHWHIIIGMLIVVGLAVAAYIDWQFLQLDLYGPRDTVGNGITVGLAKAFDNRSLSLRIEQLSNNLAQLRVVDPESHRKHREVSRGEFPFLNPGTNAQSKRFDYRNSGRRRQ